MEAAKEESLRLRPEEKSNTKKAMDEITEILNKYNCEPLCIPQKIYGQQVYVWAVNEIKPK